MPDHSYWAHSSANRDPASRTGWQLLSQHLQAVSALATDLAKAARPADQRFHSLAGLAGLFHDYGKYTDDFQRMLETGAGACQHSIHGALASYFGFGQTPGALRLTHVAAAILGHHAGLLDLEKLPEKFKQDRYCKEFSAIWQRAARDCPSLARALASIDAVATPCQWERDHLDLYTRMLFSVLVDADRLDSSGRSSGHSPLLASERLAKLLAHIQGLSRHARIDSVKAWRNQVLDDCLSAAEANHALFSLSVPTGGGKTLSSMAFALRRAALRPHDFRRIIVVIPYLSIIEQNAQVYTEIFGQDALLEHHSGSLTRLREWPQTNSAAASSTPTGPDDARFLPLPEEDEDARYQHSGLRPETENWDAPIIVTTSVRFFESLFSNRPKDLRRIHNIARSIVILDEVQTLPRRLLGPLLGMMKELSQDWGVNFVCSTATQPAFERPGGTHPVKGDLRWEPGTLLEIIREPEPLRRALKRAEINWAIDTPWTWDQVADRALASHQSLSIVNLRDHAGALHAKMLAAATSRDLEPEAVFHLSTRMCAAHRLRVLAVIRQRLHSGAPCHVVSTQLIEAGVDVDFPLVLRALAPLDSIIQAAGRADREGLATAHVGRPAGIVITFRPVDHRLPPNEYAEASVVTEAMAKNALLNSTPIQVDSARQMTDYFERYYGASGTDLGAELFALRSDVPKFATLADRFEMISNRTRDVFVADDPEARAAIASLYASGELTSDLRRVLQRHTVGLNPGEFRKARGVLHDLGQRGEIWIAGDHAYDPVMGLVF